mmetsp:Transcript_28166/g.38918  ORF Transcript_28166/g.38918 Transcript_28166/m.38918 type:complete len:89 (+) Transcript_28166:1162-1428(+)
MLCSPNSSSEGGFDAIASSNSPEISHSLEGGHGVEKHTPVQTPERNLKSLGPCFVINVETINSTQGRKLHFFIATTARDVASDKSQSV